MTSRCLFNESSNEFLIKNVTAACNNTVIQCIAFGVQSCSNGERECNLEGRKIRLNVQSTKSGGSDVMLGNEPSVPELRTDQNVNWAYQSMIRTDQNVNGTGQNKNETIIAIGTVSGIFAIVLLLLVVVLVLCCYKRRCKHQK